MPKIRVTKSPEYERRTVLANVEPIDLKSGIAKFLLGKVPLFRTRKGENIVKIALYRWIKKEPFPKSIQPSKDDGFRHIQHVWKVYNRIPILILAYQECM